MCLRVYMHVRVVFFVWLLMSAAALMARSIALVVAYIVAITEAEEALESPFFLLFVSFRGAGKICPNIRTSLALVVNVNLPVHVEVSDAGDE